MGALFQYAIRLFSLYLGTQFYYRPTGFRHDVAVKLTCLR